MSRSDAERNRRALLDAAADALAQDPGASMAQVARAAGLARATLYRHFRTRQELVAALRAEALIRATEAISTSDFDDASPLVGIRRAIGGLAALSQRFRAILLDGADLDPAFLRERGRVLAPLYAAVRRGQQAGVIRSDVAAEWVVTAMASMLVAAVHTVPADTAGDGAVADLIYRTLMHGVATRS